MSWTEITREQYRRDRLRYASDTTDAEWLLVSSFSLRGGGWDARAKSIYVP